MHHEESDEEEFVYPIESNQSEGEPSVSPPPPEEVPTPPKEDHEEDHEEFVYPEDSAHSEGEPSVSPPPGPNQPIPELVVDTITSTSTPSPPTPAKRHPSPAQLEALQAAAASGDLELLQNLFATALKSGDIEPFALANDASGRTGLTALHAAASRGYFIIVKWRMSHFPYLSRTAADILPVIEECGAIPDMEDKEGEVSILLQHTGFVLTSWPDRIA